MKYPTHKAVVFNVTYPKGVSYKKEKIGACLIPNGFSLERIDRYLRAKFTGNSMRLYDNLGSLIIAGSL